MLGIIEDVLMALVVRQRPQSIAAPKSTRMA